MLQVGIHVSDSDESFDPYQACFCNHCRYEITNNWGLVSCKGCDISYHTSCINPLIHATTESWYCSACIGKKPDMPIVTGIDDTDSEKEGNSEPVPCITSVYRLCKICGTRADGEREFLVCSHPECPYKYYHTACLKKSRVGIRMQENNTCWFCPSCLCRVCRRNKDDPLLVLCDGCDGAYHIYCMDPPCDSVPTGKWYCGKCRTKRRRKRGKRENNMPGLGSRRFNKNGVMLNSQVKEGIKIEYKKEEQRSMDLLMTAIDTVSAQDKLPN